MTETTPMLEADGLTKRYEDGTLGLYSLSMTVCPGQVYAMLGGNGAGKTTAINLFLNFIEPTAGEARGDGIVTHREPLRAKARLAYVSENALLYPNFTALQNLDFFARLGATRTTRRRTSAVCCFGWDCRRGPTPEGSRASRKARGSSAESPSRF